MVLDQRFIQIADAQQGSGVAKTRSPRRRIGFGGPPESRESLIRIAELLIALTEEDVGSGVGAQFLATAFENFSGVGKLARRVLREPLVDPEAGPEEVHRSRLESFLDELLNLLLCLLRLIGVEQQVGEHPDGARIGLWLFLERFAQLVKAVQRLLQLSFAQRDLGASDKKERIVAVLFIVNALLQISAGLFKLAAIPSEVGGGQEHLELLSVFFCNCPRLCKLSLGSVQQVFTQLWVSGLG